MKKIKYGKMAVFLLLLSLTVLGTMRLIASADAIPSDAVEVDYVNETVTVKTDQDSVVYFTEVYNKDVSRWDACEVREREVKDADGNVVSTYNAASFDISWLNTNKTVRLYLCGDVNKSVISVDITWEEDFGVKFTGTLLTTDITEAATWKQVYAAYPNFTEDTGYFLFTIEENGRDMSYFELENIQWRKGDDGVWRNYDELDLKEMNIRGVNLEFRVVADNIDRYRASSTGKISVAKLLNAPAITVNANTMTIGLKNGMEFSFDKEEWFMIPEYNKKFGTEKYVVDETTRENAIEEIYTNVRLAGMIMQELIKTKEPDFVRNTAMDRKSLETAYPDSFIFKDEGIVVYVREIGTDRKAATKIAEVLIPYASEDTSIAQPDALEFSYGESKTNTGGIVVNNTSTVKYQVGVLTPDDYDEIKDSQDDLDLTTMKWTSISAGKMLKISNKKVPKGSYLVYRIAGENGQLPSTYRIYGPMEYNELAYAGIAQGKVTAGETLTAVVSTNFEKNVNGTYDGLTFQWQRCPNVKTATPEWTDIAGATLPTYQMTADDANQYIRVVVTNVVSVSGTLKTIVKESDDVGPVTYVPPKEEPAPDGNQGGQTP